MKVRSLVFVCIVFTMCALMAAPVSAIAQTGTTALQGNPTVYDSITLTTNADGTPLSTSPTLILPLSPSAPATNSTLIANVSVNQGSWSLTVSDSGSSGHAGNMTEYQTSPAGYVSDGVYLSDPLQLSGTTVTNIASATGSNVGPITSGGGVTLYTGQASATNVLLHNLFTQKVEYADPILTTTGEIYRIDLTYTLTAN